MKISSWLQEFWTPLMTTIILKSITLRFILTGYYDQLEYCLISIWMLQLLGTNSVTLWQVFQYSIMWQRDAANTCHQSFSSFDPPCWNMQASGHQKVLGNAWRQWGWQTELDLGEVNQGGVNKAYQSNTPEECIFIDLLNALNIGE